MMSNSENFAGIETLIRLYDKRGEELTHLRSCNAELIEALQDVIAGLNAFQKHRGVYDDPRIIKAHAAIAKSARGI